MTVTHHTRAYNNEDAVKEEMAAGNGLYCELTDAPPAEPVSSVAESADGNNDGDSSEAHVAPHLKKNFKGYTLAELRYRRALTSLKIEMTTEKLKLLTSPKMQKEAKTVTGYVKGFESALRYVDYALIAYSVTRRVGNFFRRFGGKKGK